MSIFRPRTARVVTDPTPVRSARSVSFTVTPSDATCVLTPRGDRPVPPLIATGESHQTFTVPADVPGWGADLDVTAEGHQPYHAWVTIPEGDTEWPAVTLAPIVTNLPPLVRQGQFYYRQDGSPFTVIQASQFRAYEHFLNGEDLTPVFGQLQAEGFNTIRVWLLNTSVGHILPWEHPNFYDRLPAFLSFAARFGLYAELTVFTQTQSLMPTLVGQQAHYDQVAQVVGSVFCFIEGVNEGDAHDNAYDPRLSLWKPAGATFDLCGGSWGADSWGPVDGSNQPTAAVYESVRYHSNDTKQWQRKQAHGAFEMAEHYQIPAMANENTRPDRDGNPQHHRDAAAGAALLSAGSCFHSESGKHARVMDGIDLVCARAFVAGARSVDLSQRVCPYVHRTDLEGPTIIRAYQRGSAIVLIGA